MRQLKITKSITNRGDLALDKYLHDISKIDLLSEEKEIELAQRVRGGDTKAIEELTKGNLRFVVSVAKQYQNQGLSLPDLINEGNQGLIVAAERFDERKGFKFISYAVWWIRQRILQAIAEQSRIVRLPLNQVGLINKIARTHSGLEQELNREPSTSEISKELELPEEIIAYALGASSLHISIDAPMRDFEGSTLEEVLLKNDLPQTDSFLIKESLGEEVRRALKTITLRESDIITLSFGIGCKEHTLEEIGDMLGLTRERVRQIKEKAICRLRHTSRSKLLRAYLG